MTNLRFYIYKDIRAKDERKNMEPEIYKSTDWGRVWMRCGDRWLLWMNQQKDWIEAYSSYYRPSRQSDTITPFQFLVETGKEPFDGL